MAKSFLKSEPPYSRLKRITRPAIEEGRGFYVSKVPFGWALYVADPVVAKQILLKSETLGKNSPLFKYFGFDNVVLSNGEQWKDQRRIMNPVFHRAMPIKTMARVIPSLFSVIEDADGRIPISLRMKDFTLDVLGLAIFDFDFKALKGDPENWTSTYTQLTEALFDPIINVFASMENLLIYVVPKRRKAAKAVVKLNEKFDQLVSTKRQELQNGRFSNKPDNEKDLLTLMLEAELQGEALETSEQLRHNIAVFFLAGHETTAHSLSFCLYQIAKDKHIQQKLREEIISVLGDNHMDVEPTLEQLKQMKYLNMVIKENLRLNGPLDLLPSRKAAKDTYLKDIFVSADTEVVIDACAIHRDPKNWKNPDDFMPERFGEGGGQEDHEGLTWVPFGNGSRQCLGMNFSLMEQRLVLTMLLRKYEIDVPKDSIHYDRIQYEKPLSIAPNTLELTFTKRY
ncbi:hypothetical protein G6F43_007348 [Rhizopus delemar]|nr:hypothetical protein G6F43_007348 [Rhizopus delemar]KAG1638901.1 hypothetical protein G6F44_008366 [Rhizopus delemar]